MTFAIGHVQGGTNAGRKRQKPAPREWSCACKHDSELPWVRPDGWRNASVEIGKTIGAGGTDAHGVRLQPAYMSRCPDCRMERP